MAKKQLRWQLFPRSLKLPTQLELLIHVFEKNFESISSFEQKGQSSDQALAKLRNDLVSIDFKVESGKTSEQKVNVPVLFGEGGKVLKSFDADAYSEKLKTVLEVEAGRAYANNQFLKDIFQASVMAMRASLKSSGLLGTLLRLKASGSTEPMTASHIAPQGSFTTRK